MGEAPVKWYGINGMPVKAIKDCLLTREEFFKAELNHDVPAVNEARQTTCLQLTLHASRRIRNNLCHLVIFKYYSSFFISHIFNKNAL